MYVCMYAYAYIYIYIYITPAIGADRARQRETPSKRPEEARRTRSTRKLVIAINNNSY